MQKIKLLKYVIVVFLLLTIVQAGYIYPGKSDLNEFPTQNPIQKNNMLWNFVTAAATTGTTRVCVNSPPVIVNDCNMSVPWGYLYTCQINATDTQVGTNFTFNTTFPENETNLFSMYPSGIINFTPPLSSVGNHSINITVYDNSGCSNGNVSQEYNMTIVLANHPPYLSALISNATVTLSQTVVFYLSDYFIDPDSDNMTYALTQLNGSDKLNISQANGLVTAKANVCGSSQFYFTAFDTEGLNNISNLVKYTIPCASVTSPSTSTSNSGGGGMSCVPSWKCGKWELCTPNGTQIMTCEDLIKCDKNNLKHLIYKNCTYVPDQYSCGENWNCSAWTYCNNGSQTRKCADSNVCKTNIAKPAEVQSCITPASCSNGFKDGDEAGIDCGGLCIPCKSIEMPGQLGALNPVLIVTYIFVLFLVLVFLYVYRKDIEKFLDKYRAAQRKKKQKPIYLTEKQKELLVKEHNILQTRAANDTKEQAISRLYSFTIKYFMEFLEMENFTEEELVTKLDKKMQKSKNSELRKILLEYYSKIRNTEFKELNKIKIQQLIDEALYMVYLVSIFTEKDAANSVKERKERTTTITEKIYQSISNVFLALNFHEMNVAIKLYEELLKNYRTLNIKEQKKVYDDIMRAYEGIRYATKYTY